MAVPGIASTLLLTAAGTLLSRGESVMLQDKLKRQLGLDVLDISAGEVKTLCNSTMKFYFNEPILTDRNHLSMGWLRPCEWVLEHYNCGGSPLWATKAFSLLFLTPEALVAGEAMAVTYSGFREGQHPRSPGADPRQRPRT